MFTTRPKMVSGLIALSTAGVLLLGSGDASAERRFDARSLSGEYRYSIVQIYQTASGPDYCDETGTVIMDGAGNGTSTAVRRCSNPPRYEPDTGTLTYTVSPDGEAEFTDVPAGAKTHGWLVDGGRMVIIDGTNRTITPGESGADTLVMHGVAARQ